MSGGGGDLFQDLPPPTAPVVHNNNNNNSSSSSCSITNSAKQEESQVPTQPVPALKSSLKRPKPTQDQDQPPPQQAAPAKRLRFKTTTDASEKQVIDAMHKIASHIKNRSKFGKASKLAIQLIQAGSVKPSTRDDFFALLQVSMESLTTCNDPALRGDYHALFSAAQDVADCLSKKQQRQLSVWTIRAVLANDLFTDDSFVFSKATTRIKDAISNLPVATQDEDKEEAKAFEDEDKSVASSDANISKESSSPPTHEDQEHDPFGLDALIKDQISKGKTESLIDGVKSDEVEKRRFLKSQREALVACLEIAAKRYKAPWCQTSIDILSKHAFDNNSRFTTQQRAAIGKLWASIREQQTLRRQGKSVSGKLDVNAFEYLQQKYSTEKISIRRAVGGGGGRHCEQWLG